jgi:hypothetical protein
MVGYDYQGVHVIGDLNLTMFFVLLTSGLYWYSSLVVFEQTFVFLSKIAITALLAHFSGTDVQNFSNVG